jgi:hypothetical protein
VTDLTNKNHGLKDGVAAASYRTVLLSIEALAQRVLLLAPASLAEHQRLLHVSSLTCSHVPKLLVSDS